MTKPELRNLDKLTDQIYHEGIEKAEKQSESILAEAEAKKQQLLKEAEDQAETIINMAKREMDQLQKRTVGELQLKSRQFLSDLKSEIEGLLSHKILEENIKGALTDIPFMQSMILEILKNWDLKDGVELILPEQLETRISDAFTKSIREVAPNLTVTFNNRVSSGFRIAKKPHGYQLSFSEEDFISLFQTYLTSQTQKLLFSKKP